jgi:Tfp pilus assembly protein PilF
MKPGIPTSQIHPLPKVAWACAALLLILSACAPVTKAPDPATPSIPTVSEAQLKEKAAQNLALGQRQYEAGTFDDAQKSLNEALAHGVLSRDEQAQARKLLAFIHCVSNREDACRSEFRKALEINARFDLTPAEAGHPIWGPVYRNVRAQLSSASTPEPASKTLTRSEQLLADGMAKYDAGEFDAALKILQNALKESLDKKPDQLKAVKHSAFCLCLAEKWGQCRTEFMKLFDIDPAFDLTPAEAGHPSWTRTYAGAKQRWKDAHAAKDKPAKDTAAKDPPAKAAPATK